MHPLSRWDHPSGLIGLNVYTYANNKPTMQADPDGSSAISALVAGAAMFGAVAATVISGIKAVSRKVSEKKAKANLNKYVGGRFDKYPKGRFSSSSGKGFISTSEANIRNNTFEVLDAAVTSGFGAMVKKITGAATALAGGSVAKWVSKIAESEPMSFIVGKLLSPFSSSFGVRDGHYDYERYRWTETTSIFGIEVPLSTTYYEVRDYGYGYVEVWHSYSDYVNSSNSFGFVLIKEGTYE